MLQWLKNLLGEGNEMLDDVEEGIFEERPQEGHRAELHDRRNQLNGVTFIGCHIGSLEIIRDGKVVKQITEGGSDDIPEPEEFIDGEETENLFDED